MIFFLTIAETETAILEDINIYDASTIESPCLMLFDVNGSMNNVIMNNCSIYNNPDITQSTLYLRVDNSFNMSNCIFKNNYCSSSFYGNIGIAEFYPNITEKQISNCLFYGNTAISVKNIRVSGVGTNIISNCTFVDNNSSLATLNVKGNLELTNSIMNDPDNTYEISVSPGSETPSELDVSHCNILGGEEGIYDESGSSIINWLEGNIENDPMFLNSGEDPYQLSGSSPCIDTGTPDTTGLFLPPWDLLHNYRVWDGDDDGTAIIDMGCYEFGADSVSVIQNPIPNTQYLLTNYPNPFNPETKIVFELPEAGDVKLEIYNIKGQKVKTLLDCYMSVGRSEMIWQGRDDKGRKVASGVYFYKLQTNGKITSKKMLLLK